MLSRSRTCPHIGDYKPMTFTWPPFFLGVRTSSRRSRRTSRMPWRMSRNARTSCKVWTWKRPGWDGLALAVGHQNAGARTRSPSQTQNQYCLANIFDSSWYIFLARLTVIPWWSALASFLNRWLHLGTWQSQPQNASWHQRLRQSRPGPKRKQKSRRISSIL